MIKLRTLLNELYHDSGVWYHGSPSGDLRGGVSGLHLGTFKAAKQALEARIGAPVEGEWDGTREYGKTLLCGKKSLKLKGISISGFNCDIGDEDFYPTQSPKDAQYLTMSMKPAIKKYKILCPTTNTISNPYPDFKANGYMQGLLKRGIAKNGFYYKNEGEDSGSISIVVPNGTCVKEI